MTAPPAFSAQSNSRYERLSTKLLEGHSDFQATETKAVAILSSDPYNRSRQHHITKLKDVPEGGGQYRLKLGLWRFRYDIDGQLVLLYYCGLRREDTYR